ncbi:MAG: hypothetical protein AB1Z67_06085 [Candidatus Limnocylindrales bacterium]
MASTTIGVLTDERSDAHARDAVRDAIHSLTDATGEVEARLSTAAGVAGSGVRATNTVLRRRSDATLAMLGAFSGGLTAGLLVGGANRLMTVASLVPAALIGGVLLERVGGPRRRRATTPSEQAPGQ